MYRNTPFTKTLAKNVNTTASDVKEVNFRKFAAKVLQNQQQVLKYPDVNKSFNSQIP